MPRRPDAPELDLVPIMNLVTILIPFLLFSASFVSLASIDSTLPAINPTVDPKPPETPPLTLSIAVSDEGYALTAEQPLPTPQASLDRAQGPSTPASWPAAALTEALAEIKREYPKEHTVILVPERDIPYDVLVHTMDAARGAHSELFPTVVMAGGNG